jgi:hypothetical protein
LAKVSVPLPVADNVSNLRKFGSFGKLEKVSVPLKKCLSLFQWPIMFQIRANLAFLIGIFLKRQVFFLTVLWFSCYIYTMGSVHEYKRFENSLLKRIKKSSAAAGEKIAEALRAVGNFLTRRYTVVFVPHSEKKVYNLHVTVFSILCFLLVTAGIVGTFFWYSASYNSTWTVLAGKDSR